MEDYQTTEHVKEEVVDYGFVEVSQDEHELCTACLCATRTTRTLDDDALKQYYMHILTEMQPEGGVVVLQSPRFCWECVSHLKRAVRFREQVQDSYRLLHCTINTCPVDNEAACLQTSVSRPERLKTCFAFSIDIAPQEDDAQVMTVSQHDEDDDEVAVDIERHFAASEKTVATVKEESLESFCNEEENNIIRLKDVLVESPLMSNYGGHYINNEQAEENDAYTRTEVRNDVKTKYTPNSTHESTGDVNTTFVCDYCYKRFTSKAALERHIATYNIYPHNNKTVPSPCEDCAVVLCSDDQCSECPNKHNLLQHNNMKTNISKVRYQCELCHKSFSRKSYLANHIRIHTGEKTYQCEVCHKSFSQKSNLTKHITLHSGEKPYQCEVCQKSFSQKSNLTKHITLHTGEKHYQCMVCHKSFSRKYTLAEHIRTHTGEKPYQCKMCYKSFPRMINFAQHIKIHTGKKSYQCKVCHKSFSQKQHLLHHLRTHTSDKPYQCEVCYKSFSRKCNLADHIRTHTGEKPFQCKVCHKSFSQKQHLLAHLRIHTGEKPYQCELCNKSFSANGTLVKHIRTHTGEKPHQCELCNKSFSSNGTLFKHIRTHTGEKPFLLE